MSRCAAARSVEQDEQETDPLKKLCWCEHCLEPELLPDYFEGNFKEASIRFAQKLHSEDLY